MYILLKIIGSAKEAIAVSDDIDCLKNYIEGSWYENCGGYWITNTIGTTDEILYLIEPIRKI